MKLGIHGPTHFRFGGMLARLSLVLGVACILTVSPALSADQPAPTPQPIAQKSFKTPEEACAALIQAAEQFDVAQLKEILGADGADLVVTNDPVRDKNQSVAFAAQARVKNQVLRDPKTPHVATLQGIGISSGLGILSVSNLDFGSQPVGTQSAAQTVTLTNTGTGVLRGMSVAASPQFTATSSCGTSLAAGAHCTISVKFAPTLQGILLGSLTVQDDGAGSPHTVSLSGVGK